MLVVFLILFIALVSTIEIKKLTGKKKKKELVAFSFLMLIAAYLSVGQLLGIYIPNPTNGLKLIFEPIQTWFLGFFR